jgi:hypothetical protein
LVLDLPKFKLGKNIHFFVGATFITPMGIEIQLQQNFGH